MKIQQGSIAYYVLGLDSFPQDIVLEIELSAFSDPKVKRSSYVSNIGYIESKLINSFKMLYHIK